MEEETRKYSDKLRDVCALAERLGCSFGQLAIAWSLKNESVQCLLLGASNIDQLYESLQSLQVSEMRRTKEKKINEQSNSPRENCWPDENFANNHLFV